MVAEVHRNQRNGPRAADREETLGKKHRRVFRAFEQALIDAVKT